jgi:hypothetical protein
MRYRLRTLIVISTIGPPLLAGAYWAGEWLVAHPVTFIIAAMAAGVASWVLAPIAWYYELMNMVCGPDPFRPRRIKKRRVVRVRLERYAGGST